ncbi:unnamed protein product [Penicillium olsonii]|nr:unnamed protein product [Penicillium olsonii]
MLRFRPTYISPDLLSSLSDSSTIMDQAGRSSIGIKRKASAEPSPDLDLKNPHLDAPIEPGFESVPFQEKPAALEERNGEIEIRVATNDGDHENVPALAGLNCLFQSQLPNMSAKYVARVVYERAHLSIAIIKKPFEVIGGITFREFRDRKFAEIIFCAISPNHQAKGYGSHLMAHLKDYVKASSPVMDFLTYADNHAVGYFQKHGFTKDITLDKKIWKGYIKDYEGGTLMQCTMIPRIRYLEEGRMLHKQKENLKANIRTLNRNHIVHPPPAQWANGVFPIDPLSIPAIRATGWNPEADAQFRASYRESRYKQLPDELRVFLGQIQSHRQAWPFRKPVNKDDAPGYYDVIADPIDLSTIEKALEVGDYPTPQDLVNDLKLMFDNCRQYNQPTTRYYKCAEGLEQFMWELIRETPEWSDVVENCDG